MVKNIYLHLPFCLRKCRYCDFAVHAIGQSTSQPEYQPLKDKYSSYLQREIDHWQRKVKPGLYDTVYFGGGTPSIYEPSELNQILSQLERSTDCETTLELDPGTFDYPKLKGYLEAGFSRFSCGIQTLQPREFANLGRGHSFAECQEALELLSKV